MTEMQNAQSLKNSFRQNQTASCAVFLFGPKATFQFKHLPVLCLHSEGWLLSHLMKRHSHEMQSVVQLFFSCSLGHE